MGRPAITDQALKELIMGTSQLEMGFLSGKILLATLRTRVKADPSPMTLARSVAELKVFLARYQKNHPEQSYVRELESAPPAQNQGLFSVDEVRAKIAEGRNFVLAGDGALLKQLPRGNWIGGTIPYFMSAQGGVFTKEKIFVTEMPVFASSITMRTYTESTIPAVYCDAPENGLSIIIGAASPTLFSFALKAPRFHGFATRPLIGWIAGIDVADVGKVAPEVISGQDGLAQKNAAVVMHVAFPEDKEASINIINIFKQGSGDSITFPEDGFSARDAEVNGTRRNFADYLAEKGVDTKMPLVADYSGAMINTSFQKIDTTQKTVSFYAPVFRGVPYKVAAAIDDYMSAFESRVLRSPTDSIAFSCNCILNYLYSGLEGKQTGAMTGPITFGEIAYQLLNQTLAYVTIHDGKVS